METIENKSKAELLAEYRQLCEKRVQMRNTGAAELLPLSMQIGRCLGELRYRCHVTEDELNAVRQSVAGGVQ